MSPELLANAIVNIHLGYALLILMLAGKNSMQKINKIYRKTLHLVYDDYNSTYGELLASHNGISIHQKYLKHLAVEVCKSLMNLSLEFLGQSNKTNTFSYSLNKESKDFSACLFCCNR